MYEMQFKKFRSLNEETTSNSVSSGGESVDHIRPPPAINIQVDRNVYTEDHYHQHHGKTSPSINSNRMMRFTDLVDHNTAADTSIIECKRVAINKSPYKPTSITPIRIDRSDENSGIGSVDDDYDDYVDDKSSTLLYQRQYNASRSSNHQPRETVYEQPHNLLPYHHRPPVQTSDKSTATINDCATQTDDFFTPRRDFAIDEVSPSTHFLGLDPSNCN